MRGMFIVIAAGLILATIASWSRPSTFAFGNTTIPEVKGYDPVNDVKSWLDQKYFLDFGQRFAGSRSPSETSYIKQYVDFDLADSEQRIKRINITLALDLIFLAIITAVICLQALFRQRHSIENAALDGSAKTLRTFWRLKSKAQRLTAEISRRANHHD